MKTIRILTLSDDLKFLSILMDKLSDLDEEWSGSNDPKRIAVTVLSEFPKNKVISILMRAWIFDVIILDLDARSFSSLKALELEKFDQKRIISISSDPKGSGGIENMILKNKTDLGLCTEEIIEKILELYVYK